MTGRQIYNGDLVLMDRMLAPRHQDVVAALIDQQVTLKTLILEQGKCWLKSENPDYPSIMPSEELQIQGVARGIIRLLRT